MKRILGFLLLALSSFGMASTIQEINNSLYPCRFCISLSIDTHPIANWPSELGRCVIVAGGQSNSAQYFNSSYTPIHPDKQFEYLGLDGTLREFVEPVFGPSGSPLIVGSLWGKLGDDLIDAGECTTVVWALFGIGGTTISEWNSTGVYGQNITTHIRRLQEEAGVKISAFLWMQGEGDNFHDTTQSQYFERAADMITMIRTVGGYSGPIYIAKETFLSIPGAPAQISVPVQLAQMQLTTDLVNIKLGPDLDILDTSYRFGIYNQPVGFDDWTHFNGSSGRDTVSSLWVSALKAGDFSP